MDGTPIKRNVGAGRPNSEENGHDGGNFAQIIQSEFKKVLRTMTMQSCRNKKCCENYFNSDNDSDYSS